MADRILVPPTKDETVCPAVEVWNPTHWATKEVLESGPTESKWILTGKVDLVSWQECSPAVTFVSSETVNPS